MVNAVNSDEYDEISACHVFNTFMTQSWVISRHFWPIYVLSQLRPVPNYLMGFQDNFKAKVFWDYFDSELRGSKVEESRFDRE